MQRRTVPENRGFQVRAASLDCCRKASDNQLKQKGDSSKAVTTFESIYRTTFEREGLPLTDHEPVVASSQLLVQAVDRIGSAVAEQVLFNVLRDEPHTAVTKYEVRSPFVHT